MGQRGPLEPPDLLMCINGPGWWSGPEAQGLSLSLDVRSLGARRRRQIARLFLKIGGSFDKPGRDVGIGCGPRHLEQRSRCLAGMESIFSHGTGRVWLPRQLDAGTAISVPQRKYKKAQIDLVPQQPLNTAPADLLDLTEG
jgi:hypothetical protein